MMYKILHIPTGTYLMDRCGGVALFATHKAAKNHIKSHKYCDVVVVKLGLYLYNGKYAYDSDGRKMLVRHQFEIVESV